MRVRWHGSIKSDEIFVFDRPDKSDHKYLDEFLVKHGSEVVHHETYKGGGEPQAILSSLPWS